VESLSRLIGQIYDAVVDPTLWSSVLMQTCVFTHAVKAVLIHEDALEPANSLFHISNADPDWERLYLNTYMMINPARLARGRLVKPNDVVLTSDYMSERQYARTRFAREFLALRNCVDLATVILEVTPTAFTVLGVLRSQAQGFADSDLRRKLEWLAPHFRRAVTLANLFEHRHMVAESLAETLDALKAGVFMLAADSRIVHANNSAKNFLEGDQAFRVNDGKLVPQEASARTALAEALSAASSGDEALGSKTPSILFRSGAEKTLIGTVMALNNGQQRRAALRYRAVATLCLREASFEAPVVAPAIAELYKLTPREMTVLATIIENPGVPEAAYILGLSKGTIRTHLKSIFRKTGATRQADLIKVVAGAASPLQ
jgi:DNA-binding CsgD family transcriptional regulator/PAS domain-containing protein